MPAGSVSRKEGRLCSPGTPCAPGSAWPCSSRPCLWHGYPPSLPSNPVHRTSNLSPHRTSAPRSSSRQRNSAEYSPAIAYNSVRNQYLVVWENGWDGGYHDVYAQRISGSGQLLSWFALTSASGHSQTNPDVAYDPVNDRYLVVWVQDSSGNGSNWDVYGSFVPWNGPTSALTEFPICSWSSNQGHPAVAYGRAQQEFLVVWKSESVGVPGYISARRGLCLWRFSTRRWFHGLQRGSDPRLPGRGLQPGTQRVPGDLGSGEERQRHRHLGHAPAGRRHPADRRRPERHRRICHRRLA